MRICADNGVSQNKMDFETALSAPMGVWGIVIISNIGPYRDLALLMGVSDLTLCAFSSSAFDDSTEQTSKGQY
jgi:hypothetical protein